MPESPPPAAPVGVGDPSAVAGRLLPVALAHASRLINHGPTLLVTTAHGGRRNVMAAAWSMPVEFTPPRIAVVIDKSTWTHELVTASGGFGLCVPSAGMAGVTHAAGSVSGRDAEVGGDKLRHLGLAFRDGPVLGMPMVEGCLAWLECRRLPEPHAEAAYDTVFADVLWAAADPAVFRDGRWLPDGGDVGPGTLHHLGGGRFGVCGPVVRGPGVS
jgi:flavin reductase (DIM6/NTAB) family NADH-FMN oxidoreductase RutF